MAKSKNDPPPAPPYKEPEVEPDLFPLVKEMFEELGQDNSKTKTVFEQLQVKHPKIKWSKGTVNAYASRARKELGWSRSSGESEKAVGDDNTEPTLADLKRAKQFLAEFEMPSDQLKKLVQGVAKFGSVKFLMTCITALEELNG